jgi:hypothetical protein
MRIYANRESYLLPSNRCADMLYTLGDVFRLILDNLRRKKIAGVQRRGMRV